MEENRVLGRRAFVSSLSVNGLLLSCSSCAATEQVQPGKKNIWSLPEKNQIKREFDRIRSRRIILVSHCMLNQNARITTAADFPAMFETLVMWLKEHHIGIVQMPCPELMVLGLGRVSVRDGLETEEGHSHLNQIIDNLIYQIKQYQFQGFEVLAILGKEGSPACGVKMTWLDGLHQPGIGVFMRLFQERLNQERLGVEVLGVADHEQEKAIDWIAQRV